MVTEPSRRWWDPAWLPSCLAPAVGETLLAREELFNSSAMLLSEALARESRVRVHPAGDHGAWDLPFLLGPGIDRLSLWFDGLNTAGPAIPEALSHTLTPLLLGELRYMAPDPFLDPLAAGGDGMLWGLETTERRPGTPSAIRITEGPAGSSTENAMLTRQAAAWSVMGSYAHSRCDGRQVYQDGRFQNLALHLDRAAAFGALRLTGIDRCGRFKMFGNRKLVWETGLLSGGSQFWAGETVRGQIRLVRRNDRLQWWGSGTDARRRTTSTEATLQASAETGVITFLGSCAIDRTSFNFTGAGCPEVHWTRTGTGIAMGAKAESRQGSAVATIGLSDPWWHEAHLRGHLVVSGRPLPRLGLALETWAGRAPVFTPRLEPDAGALLGDEFLLPTLETAGGGPVRRLWHAEARVDLSGTSYVIGGGPFVRKIEDGLGFDPEQSSLLAPSVRETLSLESLLSDVTLVGGYGHWRIGLPLGADISGDVTALLHPGLDDLPVLLPAYQGRVALSVRGLLFKGDLHWGLRLLSFFRGSWCTPYGDRPANARFDGEAHATIGRAHIFLALRNLEDEWGDSATYDNAWIPLAPLSCCGGLEWHFLD